jgi:hypothetical protein
MVIAFGHGAGVPGESPVPHPLIRVARIVPVLLVVAAGCGGSVVDPSATADAGRRRDGGRESSDRDRTSPPPPEDAPPNDDFPTFREDACVDVNAPPPMIECDPFVQTTCPLGMACYPVPPRATGSCQPGRYSTICLPPGPGTQGSPCGDATECAASFICVKSGQGDMCVKICRTDMFNSCTDGRVCREVDVTGSGLGGCE